MSFGLRSFSARSVPYNITTFLQTDTTTGEITGVNTVVTQFTKNPVVVPTKQPDSKECLLCTARCKSASNTHCELGCARSIKTLVCYTPIDAEGITSCSKVKEEAKLVFTTDTNAAIIPAGAIIDSVEFFGVDYFATKDTFTIGLGQLNKDISFPLVQDADADTANERVGGCREFLSTSPDGKNDKSIVLCDSNVNVEFNGPVVSGYMQIVIRYHFKVL